MFHARRIYGLLSIALVAFAAYASLLPLRVTPRPLDTAWADFWALMPALEFQPFSRTNFLANVLLFVPIGFFMLGTLVVDRGRRLNAFIAVVAGAAVLAASVLASFTVEFLQVFTPRRIPSLYDIVAQTIGCFIGIVGWFAVGARLTAWLRAASDRTRDDRAGRLLAAYALAWGFVNLAPFDITLDPAELARRVRGGVITLAPVRDADVTTARIIWDAAAALVSAVPLGLLGLVGGSGRAIRRPPVLAFAVGGAAVVVVELAQIFIRSHSSEATDILMGCLGVAFGVWIGLRVFAPRLEASSATQRIRTSALVAFAGWCAFLLFYHWLPYDFVLDTQAVKQKLDGISLIPFAGYHIGSDLGAFNDLLCKLGLSIPLGGIATFLLRGAIPPLVTIAVLAAAACIFGLIEVGQFFIPSRTPDPTDVFVGIAGVYVGMWLGRWVRPTHEIST